MRPRVFEAISIFPQRQLAKLNTDCDARQLLNRLLGRNADCEACPSVKSVDIALMTVGSHPLA